MSRLLSNISLTPLPTAQCSLDPLSPVLTSLSCAIYALMANMYSNYVVVWEKGSDLID